MSHSTILCLALRIGFFTRYQNRHNKEKSVLTSRVASPMIVLYPVFAKVITRGSSCNELTEAPLNSAPHLTAQQNLCCCSLASVFSKTQTGPVVVNIPKL